MKGGRGGKAGKAGEARHRQKQFQCTTVTGLSFASDGVHVRGRTLGVRCLLIDELKCALWHAIQEASTAGR